MHTMSNRTLNWGFALFPRVPLQDILRMEELYFQVLPTQPFKLIHRSFESKVENFF